MKKLILVLSLFSFAFASVNAQIVFPEINSLEIPIPSMNGRQFVVHDNKLYVAGAIKPIAIINNMSYPMMTFDGVIANISPLPIQLVPAAQGGGTLQTVGTSVVSFHDTLYCLNSFSGNSNNPNGPWFPGVQRFYRYNDNNSTWEVFGNGLINGINDNCSYTLACSNVNYSSMYMPLLPISGGTGTPQPVTLVFQSGAPTQFSTISSGTSNYYGPNYGFRNQEVYMFANTNTFQHFIARTSNGAISQASPPPDPFLTANFCISNNKFFAIKKDTSTTTTYNPYYIKMANFNGSGNLTTFSPPINIPPHFDTAVSGQFGGGQIFSTTSGVYLYVKYDGYLYKFNWADSTWGSPLNTTPIVEPGANGNSLVFTNAIDFQGDTYFAYYTNYSKVIRMHTIQSTQITAPTALLTTSTCQGQLVNFNCTHDPLSTNTTYSWTINGVITTSQNSNLSHSYSNSGYDTVSLATTITVNGTQYTSHDTIFITVNPIPTLIGNDTAICLGQSTLLSVNGNATYYIWTTTSGAVSPTVVSPTVTSTYIVTGHLSGCTASDNNVTVTVYPLPSASIMGDNSICLGTSTTISVLSGNTYSWSTGATTESISVNSSNNYSVTVSSSAGCTANSSISVTVNTPTPATIIQLGNGILNAQGNYTNYVWYWNADSIGMSFNGIWIPTQNGEYTVMTTDANGCTALSLPFSITNVGIHDIQNSTNTLVFPNPFASNFMVHSDGAYELIVYDMVGRVLSHTHEQNNATVEAGGDVVVRVKTGTTVKYFKLVKSN